MRRMALRFHYLPGGTRGRLVLLLVALMPTLGLLAGLSGVALAALATLAVLVGWFGTAFFVIRPASTLIAATCRIAEGRLDARVGLTRCVGQLGDLGAEFDRLAGLIVAEHEGRASIEADLRRSVAHHEDVLANLSEVVFQTDVDGRWLLLSPAWSRITGWPVAETLGQPYIESVAPEDRDG